MSRKTEKEEHNLVCGKCAVPLEKGTVQLSYLENTFPAEMLKCPCCGQVYIPEELVQGRIREIEQTLEDK